MRLDLEEDDLIFGDLCEGGDWGTERGGRTVGRRRRECEGKKDMTINASRSRLDPDPVPPWPFALARPDSDYNAESKIADINHNVSWPAPPLPPISWPLSSLSSAVRSVLPTPP